MRKRLFIIILSVLHLVGCSDRYSYELPDGMVFTVWNEPIMGDSTVLIIPGKHYGNEKPKVSYVIAKWDLDNTIWFFYTLDKNSVNYSLLRDRFIVKCTKEEYFQIVNIPESPWEIVEYSEEFSKCIYYYDTVNTKFRRDISWFRRDVGMTSTYASYHIGHELAIRPNN